jgi:hypothetical protein
MPFVWSDVGLSRTCTTWDTGTYGPDPTGCDDDADCGTAGSRGASTTDGIGGHCTTAVDPVQPNSPCVLNADCGPAGSPGMCGELDGSGYQVNDILTLQSNFRVAYEGKYRVSSVDANGSITAVSIADPGSHPATGGCHFGGYCNITGGSGLGTSVDPRFSPGGGCLTHPG